MCGRVCYEEVNRCIIEHTDAKLIVSLHGEVKSTSDPRGINRADLHRRSLSRVIDTDTP